MRDSGWQVFPPEPVVLDWVASALSAALAHDEPLRHGGTWQVGVDALPNDAAGRVGDGPPFGGAALRAAGAMPLHPAQISVVHPGYPRRDPEESEAAHRFRRNRDAAHLDGLLPEGPGRRRHLREPHAWILGIALTEADAQAAPLVIWEGSHHVIGVAFAQIFEGIPPGAWGDLDVTEAYQAARAKVFETCRRRALPLRVGETVLLHRHLIHGVAPWAEGGRADPAGRAIAYFRPCFEQVERWLNA
ncbi:hypothetical protein V8J82_16775 [Gymnodinialimonas sp. 2305UL16-5]|uniref:hypothetical protein n=1 Tax=Gymnodinialimonas mytili TaxID=3126503 RepID=UPI0030A50174